MIFCFYRLSAIFFFNDTPTTEIYTLSLHDALPICYFLEYSLRIIIVDVFLLHYKYESAILHLQILNYRSEEHTSELQSHHDLVCRLLLEKKKQNKMTSHNTCTHLYLTLK